MIFHKQTYGVRCGLSGEEILRAQGISSKHISPIQAKRALILRLLYYNVWNQLPATISARVVCGFRALALPSTDRRPGRDSPPAPPQYSPASRIYPPSTLSPYTTPTTTTKLSPSSDS